MVGQSRLCIRTDVMFAFEIDFPRVHEMYVASKIRANYPAVELSVVTGQYGFVVFFEFGLRKNRCCSYRGPRAIDEEVFRSVFGSAGYFSSQVVE